MIFRVKTKLNYLVLFKKIEFYQEGILHGHFVGILHFVALLKSQ